VTAGRADGPAEPTPPGLAISITTPPLWWDLPLDPVTGRDEMQRLVAERTRHLGDGVDRAGIAATLDRAAVSARAMGAVFASQFGVVDEGLEFAASVLVAVHRNPPGESGPDADAGPGESDVSIGPIQTAGLGAVTRRLSRLRIGAPGAGGAETCLAQYFVAVPESGVTVVISGSCVGVDDLAAVGDLFDEIVGTVAIKPEDG